MLITQGKHDGIALPAGYVLSVVSPDDSVGIVFRLSDNPGGASQDSWAIAAGGSANVGPYLYPTRFDVACTSGSGLVASTDVSRDEPLLRRITVTLTDAQIKALPTTPVEILPAPGAGKYLLPLRAALRVVWVADYTNLDAAAAISVGLLSDISSANAASLLAGGGPDGASAFSVPDTVSGVHDTDLENKALQLSVVNGVLGDFTGGDPANTLKIMVHYVVVNL